MATVQIIGLALMMLTILAVLIWIVRTVGITIIPHILMVALLLAVVFVTGLDLYLHGDVDLWKAMGRLIVTHFCPQT